MSDQEWSVTLDDPAAVARLHAVLLAQDQAQRHGGPPDTLVFTVDQFTGLRVEVYAREHPPPHFRVSCQRGSANYRISNCTQLSGNLRREYSTIRAWHAENKDKLIEAWNRMRPSDCPVGEYREP